MGAGAIALTVLSLVLEATTYRAVPGAVMVPIDSNMVPPTGSYPVNQTDDFTEFSMKVRTCAWRWALSAEQCAADRAQLSAQWRLGAL